MSRASQVYGSGNASAIIASVIRAHLAPLMNRSFGQIGREMATVI
jgi:hypothetical protein